MTTRTKSIDWWLLIAVLGLTSLGTLLVWSATAHRGELTGGDSTAYLTRHLANVTIGSILLVAVAVVEHRWVRILTPIVYVGAVAGLCAVLAIGSTVNGSRSWLILGGWSLQPSEFAKVAVVVGSALWIAERGRNRWRSLGAIDLLGLLLIAGVPAVLIILQPDLGTVLVLAATTFGVLAVAGVSRLWLAGLCGVMGVAAVAGVWLGVLRDYQVDRFLAFTDPDWTPGVRATTPNRRGSLSATVASSARVSSTDRRRGRVSCPNSRRTSCSRSPARNSA